MYRQYSLCILFVTFNSISKHILVMLVTKVMCKKNYKLKFYKKTLSGNLEKNYYPFKSEYKGCLFQMFSIEFWKKIHWKVICYAVPKKSICMCKLLFLNLSILCFIIDLIKTYKVPFCPYGVYKFQKLRVCANLKIRWTI